MTMLENCKLLICIETVISYHPFRTDAWTASILEDLMQGDLIEIFKISVM